MGAPADKSLALQLDRPAASTADDGAFAPMPKPKVSASSAKTARVPTRDELTHTPQPLDFGDAHNAELMESCTTALDSLFHALDHNLETTLTHLSEPPPKRDEDRGFVIELLELVVGVAATYMFGGLAGKLVAVAGGGAPSRTAQNAVSAGSKQGGVKLGAAFTSMRTKHERAVDEVPRGQLHDLGAATWLEEFSARQRDSLIDLNGRAKTVLILLRPRLTAADTDAMRRLAADLASEDYKSALSAEFQTAVVVGWLNFCSSLTLGEKKDPTQPDIPGANEVGGHRRTSSPYFGWASEIAGSVGITIDVTDPRKLVFASANVDAGPGAARMLSNTHLSLAELPVYRSIRLRDGDSKLSTTTAFHITPDGNLEVNLDDPLLAAIGGSPVADQAIGADLVPLGDESTERRAIRQFNGAYANEGAKIVTRFLTTIQARRLNP
jgi:hypothetical protein